MKEQQTLVVRFREEPKGRFLSEERGRKHVVPEKGFIPIPRDWYEVVVLKDTAPGERCGVLVVRSVRSLSEEERLLAEKKRLQLEAEGQARAAALAAAQKELEGLLPSVEGGFEEVFPGICPEIPGIKDDEWKSAIEERVALDKELYHAQQARDKATPWFVVPGRTTGWRWVLGPAPAYAPFLEVVSFSDPGELPRPATSREYAEWSSRLDASRTWERAASQKGTPPPEILREQARRTSPAFQQEVRRLEERVEEVSARLAQNAFAGFDARHDAWSDALCVALEELFSGSTTEDQFRLLLWGEGISPRVVEKFYLVVKKGFSVFAGDTDFRPIRDRIWKERKQ